MKKENKITPSINNSDPFKVEDLANALIEANIDYPNFANSLQNNTQGNANLRMIAYLGNEIVTNSSKINNSQDIMTADNVGSIETRMLPFNFKAKQKKSALVVVSGKIDEDGSLIDKLIGEEFQWTNETTDEFLTFTCISATMLSDTVPVIVLRNNEDGLINIEPSLFTWSYLGSAIPTLNNLSFNYYITRGEDLEDVDSYRSRVLNLSPNKSLQEIIIRLKNYFNEEFDLIEKETVGSNLGLVLIASEDISEDLLVSIVKECGALTFDTFPELKVVKRAVNLSLDSIETGLSVSNKATVSFNTYALLEVSLLLYLSILSDGKIAEYESNKELIQNLINNFDYNQSGVTQEVILGILETAGFDYFSGIKFLINFNVTESEEVFELPTYSYRKYIHIKDSDVFITPSTK